MRRRPNQALLEAVPLELRRFVVVEWLPFVEAEMPADYPGTTDQWREQDATDLWARARVRWAEANGWPTGVVDLLRENVRIRRGC